MSQSHYETITCGKCQHTKKFVVWDFINISKDPLLLDPLLAGELTTFRCRRCQTTTPIARDLLYHDLTRRFALWLRHSSQAPSTLDAAAQALLDSMNGDYTCRIVTSFADAVEKIRLTVDGLSDSLMELVKLGVRSRLKLSDETPLHYAATEIVRTGGKLFVFRCAGEHGPFEIRSPEVDSAAILRDHLRSVQAQAITIGRQWVQVDRAHVAKAMGLDADVPPARAKSDGNAIGVFIIGKPPEFSTPHEMDEWVAAGATTYQSTIWQIGREVSLQDAQQYRDRKTGHLYVVYRRAGKDWKRQFVARKVFEELKAKEAGM